MSICLYIYFIHAYMIHFDANFNIKYSLDGSYKPSRYESEALILWTQRYNTAKPTRCYNGFPQVQSDSCKTCNGGSGCSFYRTPSL
jgi:hypothetical protein